MPKRSKIETPDLSEETDGSDEVLSTPPTRRRGRPKKDASVEGGAYFAPPSPQQMYSSGCTILDCVLGGGWAKGRVANLVGSQSAGKTLLGIEAAVNFLKDNPTAKVYYIETEAAFDMEYALSLGMPTERVEFPNDSDSDLVPIDTVEKLFNKFDEIIEAADDEESLIVVDSLDALSDEAEIDRDVGDASFGGGKAKKLSELFRRLNQRLNKKKCSVLIISQIRDALGVMFGKKQTRSGGKALDFYASQVVWLNHMGKIIKTINKVERTIGVKVKAKAEKNKVGLPFRDCVFHIYFNFGVEDVISNLDFLKTIGITEVDGKDASDIISSLDSISPTEYADIRTKTKELVVAKWKEIERGFFINRKKY